MATYQSKAGGYLLIYGGGEPYTRPDGTSGTRDPMYARFTNHMYTTRSKEQEKALDALLTGYQGHAWRKKFWRVDTIMIPTPDVKKEIEKSKRRIAKKKTQMTVGMQTTASGRRKVDPLPDNMMATPEGDSD